MNKKISIISTLILVGTIAIFFVTLCCSFFSSSKIFSMISYLVCIFLSWSFIIVTIANDRLAKDSKKIASSAAKLFAVIYSVFVSIVYFTQLTVVNQNVLGEQIVNAFNFTYSGSWLFSLDLIGYGIMALSTLFLALSLNVKNKFDKALKILLYIHSVFIVCIFMPMTDIFLKGSNNANSGTFALMFWCLMFIPIALLYFCHFKKEENL
jgi:hypothetical protein